MSFGRLGALGRGFGRLGAPLGRASGSAPQSPNAPGLVWVSASSDATPDFDVDLPNGNGNYKDAAAGDHLVIKYQLQSGGAISTYLDYTLTSGDITADTINVSGVSPVANGVYYFWAYLTRGALTSANSANVGVTITASVARQSASIASYLNAEASSRSFGSIDHYVVY